MLLAEEEMFAFSIAALIAGKNTRKVGGIEGNYGKNLSYCAASSMGSCKRLNKIAVMLVGKTAYSLRLILINRPS